MTFEAQREYNQRQEQRFQPQTGEVPRTIGQPTNGCYPYPQNQCYGYEFYQIRLILHDKIQPTAFEYEGKSILLKYSGHVIHKLANHWKSGFRRDGYNISPEENWAESIVKSSGTWYIGIPSSELMMYR